MSTPPDRPDPTEPVAGPRSDLPQDPPNASEDTGAQADPAPGSAPVTEPIPDTAERPVVEGSEHPAPPPPPSTFSPQAEAPEPPPPPMPPDDQPTGPQPPAQPGSASGASPAYGAAPAGPAPAYGAPVGAPLSPQEEKGWSLAAHLLVLVGGFVAPLIIWLVFKGRGPFLEHHAKESLNFQITVTIAAIVSVLAMFVLVGFVMILLLVPWMIIMPIVAAVKANNGEWYRYPLTLRLIK